MCAVYEAEGIPWLEGIEPPDNQLLLELLEAAPRAVTRKAGATGAGVSGLFVLLDDVSKQKQTSAAGAADERTAKYVDKVLEQAKVGGPAAAALLRRGATRGPTFVLRHFAGHVTYDASGFVERNTEKLTAQLHELLRVSTNPLLQLLFGDGGHAADHPTAERESASHSSKGVHTVSGRFREDLKQLMQARARPSNTYPALSEPRHVLRRVPLADRCSARGATRTSSAASRPIHIRRRSISTPASSSSSCAAADSFRWPSRPSSSSLESPPPD